MQVVMKPVSSLKPWSYCSSLFRDMPQREFEELVASVAEHGVLVPVAIRPDGVILCGHQRVKAAAQAGLPEVPCVEVVLPSEDHYRLYAIDDNLQRRHMSPVERARVFVERKQVVARLQEAGLGTTGRIRDVAASPLGISGRQASKYEAITRLPKEVQQMVDSGEIGVEVAAAIAKVPDPEAAVKIAREAARRNLGHKDVSELVRASLTESEAPAPDRSREKQAVAGARSSAAQSAEERLRIGGVFAGLGQLVELAEISPDRLVSACTREELMRLADLASEAERWLRALRRALAREMALRETFMKGA